MTRVQKIPKQDPHQAREALKYDKPIASREYILSILQNFSKPMTYDEIINELGYDHEEDLEALRRRLRAMERDGQVIRNRKQAYIPVTQTELLRGRVIGHPDGFGFLVPDDGSSDLFLGPRIMRSLLHGDKAVMRIAGIDNKGRREGALVEVLERANTEIVGKLYEDAGVYFVEPDNKRLHLQVLLANHQAANQAKPGQIVKVKIIEHPTHHHEPIGEVIEIIGDGYAPGMEIDIAIRTHGIIDIWPEELIKASKKVKEKLDQKEIKNRKDIRNLPLVTIDGEDAKDFDDAVFCEEKPYGWRLRVAIADVSFYVTPDNIFDQEAQKRGTSVYFPNRVVPMLPEILSNGLCSLKPEVDRFCMVCEMQITHDGKINRSSFYQATMHSHARLTYNQVAQMLFEDNTELQAQHSELLPHLHNLYQLYKVLSKARRERGSIDFDTIEHQIGFDEQGHVANIIPVVRNDAHRIIEECMIAANVAAARFLKRHKIPALYRIHEGPDKQKLTDLKTFLTEMHLPLPKGLKFIPEDYAKVIEVAKGRPDLHLIQTKLLRSFTQAVYSPKRNVGHFGLALTDYAHFTSPIRRYPDLLVHRAIAHVLQGKAADSFTYSEEDMINLGDQCSMLERRADEASRDALDVLKCRYMEDKVGDYYQGIINSVAPFGLFVELSDISIEGVVHVTALGNDFFHFDPIRQQMTGENTGKRYALGDSIEVQVVRVSVEDRRIDLILKENKIKPVVPKKKKAPKKAKKAKK